MKLSIQQLILLCFLLAISNTTLAQRKTENPTKQSVLDKHSIELEKNTLQLMKSRKSLESKLGRNLSDAEWQEWLQQRKNNSNRHVATINGNVHANHRGCGFIEANHWDEPEVKETAAAFEQRLQQKIQERRVLNLAGRITGTVYQIPVVVHIIHNGEPVGEGTNISAEQVYSQIEVLNEDFRKRNPDASNIRDQFAPIQGDVEVEFVLALEDENGNPLAEPGITRFQGSQTVYSTGAFDALVKPITQFNPYRYANFWTANLETGLLGYAQFPGNSGVDGIPFSGPENQDGVVMGYRYFGSLDKVSTPQLEGAGEFAYGRTTTHEVGHWLGLRHISGDGSGDCSIDDFVDDTPLQSEQLFRCPSAIYESCGSLDMWENFMDYVDDRCMNSFTQGQVDRMRTVIETDPMRDSLTRSDVLVATEGLTVASFSSTTEEACMATPITFTSVSTVILSDNREITHLEWQFEGGHPATATGDNIEVSYDALGMYDVTLIATSAAGKDTLTLEDYINIITITPSTEVFPLTADFESGGVPPVAWDADRAWELTTVAGFGSSRAAVMDNFNVDYSNESAIMYSPVMSTSGLDGVKISFDVAYTYFEGLFSNNYDSLQVGYLDPCSGQKTILWKEGGVQLSTADPTDALFIPAGDEEWKSVETYIANFDGIDLAQFFIEGIAGSGNRLYLDNIQIENIVGSLSDWHMNAC